MAKCIKMNRLCKALQRKERRRREGASFQEGGWSVKDKTIGVRLEGLGREASRLRDQRLQKPPSSGCEWDALGRVPGARKAQASRYPGNPGESTISREQRKRNPVKIELSNQSGRMETKRV